MNIFNDFYDDANFHIDMNLISTNEIKIIRHYSTIVYNEIVFVQKFDDSNSIVMTSLINKIFVFFNDRNVRKLSKKMFKTFCEFFFFCIMQNAIKFIDSQKS